MAINVNDSLLKCFEQNKKYSFAEKRVGFLKHRWSIVVRPDESIRTGVAHFKCIPFLSIATGIFAIIPRGCGYRNLLLCDHLLNILLKRCTLASAIIGSFSNK